MGILLLLVVAACDGLTTAAGDASPAPPDASAAPAGEATMDPSMAEEILTDPCEHVAAVEDALAVLRSVELRLPNRIALEIELGKVLAAFAELSQADFGELSDEVEEPLQRLSYRMLDLELAVEDFRTNPRPRRAAPHVEEESEAVADALAAFALLARC